eukprot:GHVU01205015.1.p1 GENE.GHVU01205015.1~~GHVU01205015.1.p1  ORF type:complete len:562 (-),score=110.41 GHVU01205015.1:76-1761(-)
MFRHGARTISGPARCWPNYAPKWECDDATEAIAAYRYPLTIEEIQNRRYDDVAAADEEEEGGNAARRNAMNTSHADHDDAAACDLEGTCGDERLRVEKRRKLSAAMGAAATSRGKEGPGGELDVSLLFPKQFDVQEREGKSMSGGCTYGQLLPEGYDQEAVNGVLLAEAYFLPSAETSDSSNNLPKGNDKENGSDNDNQDGDNDKDSKRKRRGGVRKPLIDLRDVFDTEMQELDRMEKAANKGDQRISRRQRRRGAVDKGGCVPLDKYLYLRSTDIERTRVSGATVTTAMLRAAANAAAQRGVPVDNMCRAVDMHLMDIREETMFPNKRTNPGLAAAVEAFGRSRELRTLEKKLKSTSEEVRQVVGLPKNEALPEDLMDCVMTSVCTGQNHIIPTALRPGTKLHNSAITGVQQLVALEHTWQDSLISRSGIATFMRTLRRHVALALAGNRGESLLELSNRYPDNFDWISDQARKTGLKEQGENGEGVGDKTKAEKGALQGASRSSSSDGDGGTNHDEETQRLRLYSGHDTTLLAVLASLGGTVFDGIWPRYASMVGLEVSE